MQSIADARSLAVVHAGVQPYQECLIGAQLVKDLVNMLARIAHQLVFFYLKILVTYSGGLRSGIILLEDEAMAA